MAISVFRCECVLSFMPFGVKTARFKVHGPSLLLLLALNVPPFLIEIFKTVSQTQI